MIFRVRHLSLLAGVAALATLVASCGGTSQSSSTNDADGTPSSPRTVEVAMEDIKFDPTTLTVKAGETIDFRFVNNGKITHDAFIGDAAAQMDHDAEMAEMAEMADMGSHSTGESAITVQPGDSGEMSFTFEQPGTIEVGCHQPGHYAAGMKIDVTVEK